MGRSVFIAEAKGGRHKLRLHLDSTKYSLRKRILVAPTRNLLPDADAPDSEVDDALGSRDPISSNAVPWSCFVKLFELRFLVSQDSLAAC